MSEEIKNKIPIVSTEKPQYKPAQEEKKSVVGQQKQSTSPPVVLCNFEKDAKQVIDSDDFIIHDIFYQNELGWTLWTTVFIRLKEFKKSPYFFNKDQEMRYEIKEGEGWILVGVEGKVAQVGDTICIARGLPHMVMNNSRNALVYEIQAPGKLDLREYLGIKM